MGVNPKIWGKKPKMDGENNGKTPIKMDNLGVDPSEKKKESAPKAALQHLGSNLHCCRGLETT